MKEVACVGLALAIAACAPVSSSRVARPEIDKLPLKAVERSSARDCRPGAFRAVLSENARNELRRVFLPARLHESDVLLLLDTGSAASFVYDALDVPRRRETETARIGCYDVELPHRNNRGQSPHAGLDVVGTVGTDLLRNGRFELDLRSGILTMLANGALPSDVTWDEVKLEVVRGIALVHVTVGGRARRMMIDTGTADLLMLDPSANEEGVPSTTDSAGRTVLLAPARDTVRFDGMESVEVRSWHTRRHPSFQKHVASLGGAIDGMVGLSTLGRRRVVIDFEGRAMFLERL